MTSLIDLPRINLNPIKREVIKGWNYEVSQETLSAIEGWVAFHSNCRIIRTDELHPEQTTTSYLSSEYDSLGGGKSVHIMIV